MKNQSQFDAEMKAALYAIADAVVAINPRFEGQKWTVILQQAAEYLGQYKDLRD